MLAGCLQRHFGLSGGKDDPSRDRTAGKYLNRRLRRKASNLSKNYLGLLHCSDAADYFRVLQRGVYIDRSRNANQEPGYERAAYLRQTLPVAMRRWPGTRLVW